MTKKISNTGRRFAKQIIRASQKKKKMPKKPSKKIIPKAGIKPEKEDYITILKNRINGLEQELRISEKARQEEININKQRIEELYSELNHLRQRVYGVKTARQKRVEELERKIKEKADVGIQRIIRMERQLKEMEERYEKLKQSKKYSPSNLEVIKRAIESLKQKIEAKKKEMIPAEEFLPPSGIRHTMKFEMPAPKKGIPAEEIKPELPSIKEMPGKSFLKEAKIPKVPLELVKKPKRTFGQKLRIFFFGKPKPKFSKTL